MICEKTRLNFDTDKILVKKLKVISKRNFRSMSREVEKLCIDYVEDYEKKYGKIDIA